MEYIAHIDEIVPSEGSFTTRCFFEWHLNLHSFQLYRFKYSFKTTQDLSIVEVCPQGDCFFLQLYSYLCVAFFSPL